MRAHEGIQGISWNLQDVSKDKIWKKSSEKQKGGTESKKVAIKAEIKEKKESNRKIRKQEKIGKVTRKEKN